MNIRKSLAPLICAAAAAVAAPMLSLADTTTAPAPVTTPAPASPVAAPADTTTAPAEPATTTAPAAPAATDTTSTDRPTSYTMVKGDTLDSIAHKFDTSIKAIAALNKITKAQYKKLRPGKVLQIPPATATASTPAPAAPTPAAK